MAPQQEYMRRYYAKHGDRIRRMAQENRLRRRYGLTVEAVEQMKIEQDGACLICARVPDGPLHIDHDHDSGKVRGLLCGTCNQGLGLFYENPARLRAAAEYLERHDLEERA